MLERARAASPFSVTDLIALVGLLVLAYGLAMIWVPLALVATGTLLIVYAVFAAMPPRTS